MSKNIFVGGLVAIGFDESGEHMLTVSHSGRGVYSTRTWDRLARDNEVVYPEEGMVHGIGPVESKIISVAEEYEGSELKVETPNQSHKLVYCEGTISVEPSNTQQVN